MITVISLGGSIVAPDKVDVDYLSDFVLLIKELLEEDPGRKFIFVTGGGAPARVYQKAFYEVLERSGRENSGDNAADSSACQERINESADWIGIMATRLNAELVRSVFGDYCPAPVITNPLEADSFRGRVMIASGWKPGFSSDNDAVLLAERFGAKLVINLSNIEKVCTADPKLDPSAKPITRISWKDFRKMTGDKWTPGKNLPFDPVASANAEKKGIKVICALGSDLRNLKNIISGRDFSGTTIG